MPRIGASRRVDWSLAAGIAAVQVDDKLPSTEDSAMSETDRLIEMVKYSAMSDKNTCWPAPTRWSLKEAKETLLKQAELAAAERLVEPRFKE